MAEPDLSWVNAYLERVQKNVPREPRLSSFDEPASTSTIELAVVCALEIEQTQAMRAFGVDPALASVVWNDNLCRRESLLRLPNGSDVRICFARAARPGIADAAVVATQLIRDCGPRYLAMTGICGGIRGVADLGDLLIGDPVFEHSSGAIGDDGQLAPEPYQHILDNSIRSLLVEFQADFDFIAARKSFGSASQTGGMQTHLGPMGCGPAVIKDADFADSLVQGNRKLVGIDMESAGIARAVGLSSRCDRWLVVKCVADFADATKDDSVHALGSFVSAKFLCDFVSRHHASLWPN